MFTTIPAVIQQIEQELSLTSDECHEFQKLRVMWLGSITTSEWEEVPEYETLLDNASQKILDAMERYMLSILEAKGLE